MPEVRPPSPKQPEQPIPSRKEGKNQEMRVGYNKNTHSFQPLGKGDKAKTSHLHEVEKEVNTAKKIVPDYTSPTYLQKVKTKNQAKGEQLNTSTKGVGAFFSGQAGKLNQFLASIRESRLK